MVDAAWRPFGAIATRAVIYGHVHGPKPTALSVPTVPSGSDDQIEVGLLGRPLLSAHQTIRRSGIDRRVMQGVTSAAEEGGYFDDRPLLADLTTEQLADCEIIASRL